MATTTRFSGSYEVTNPSGNNSFFAESSINHPSGFLSAWEVSALQLLSNGLGSVFDSPETSYSDAKLVLADGQEIPFHRCILSARIPVFKSALAAAKSQKSTVVKIQLKEIARDYDVGFDSVMAVLAYVYSGRVRPPPKGGADCVDDHCFHVACRPAVDFMVEVLYLAFVFQIPELGSLYERHFLDLVDKIVIEDMFVICKLATLCGNAYNKLLARCMEIIIKSDIELVTLEKSLPLKIVEIITYVRKQLGFRRPELGKNVKDIFKALDSDDIELLMLLLIERYTNLDEAYALHFAFAHCDVNTALDLLDLELADVNHRNHRGYTVLHVAAMRKEPKLIVSLLTKGANALDTTLDGRTALVIAKRLTKAAEYNSAEQGKPSLKGGLCIEVLEHAQKLAYPFPQEESLLVAPEELKMRLLYYENRVALARLLFPAEAQVVRDIAKLDRTCEFTDSSNEPDHHTGEKRTSLDLTMAPFVIQEKHLSRLIALSKTVELGKRYFPRCSLDQFMDTEDLNHLASVEEDTPEKRLQKNQRYMELQETLMKTFSKEDEEALGKSSTSKSTTVVRSSGKPSHRRLRVNKRDSVKRRWRNGGSGVKKHIPFHSRN